MSFQSMTGFGESKTSLGRIELVVEIKSVNHRFLDFSFRLPPVYSRFEVELSRLVKDFVRRGRIEIYVSRKTAGESEVALQFNEELFDKYLEIYSAAFKRSGFVDPQNLVSVIPSILSRREVLEVNSPEMEAEVELSSLKAALTEALQGLVAMRTKEGKALGNEIKRMLKDLEEQVGEISKNAESAPKVFKQRLEERLQRLNLDIQIDPERVSQEAAILAERVDVSEELARLTSHIAQFRAVVTGSEVGRKLDFLLQEMGREVNTIGSKCQSADISRLVVESKAVLEKLREQVQNIE